jgi:aspartate/methionine/tyrosine aminotransferase
MRPFQPFEYMAWAKAVAPGARYPLHLSGIGPPAADSGLLPALAGVEWTAPAGSVLPLVQERLTAWQGVPGADLIVTGGASEAVFVALAALVTPGAAVVVEQPAYRAMERAAAFLGGVPVPVERYEHDGWRLDPDRLDALLAESGARAVAITDPHNPTGICCTAAERAAIVRAVERHDAVLVVDEIFAPFRGPGRPPAWASLSERVLSLGSLTKGWGLSALRCGWVVGAPARVQPARQVFDLLGVNPPTITLALAAAALDRAESFDRRALAASERVRAAFATVDWAALDAALVPPDTAITAYPRLPERSAGSQATAARLRATEGIQTVPGHFFGSDRHLRLGFDPDATDGATALAHLTTALTTAAVA